MLLLQNKFLKIGGIFLVGLGIIWTACSKSHSTSGGTPPPGDSGAKGKTFINPIKSSGPDPWVIKKGDFYYYTQTSGNRVSIWKTQFIEDLSSAKEVVIWNAPTEGNIDYNRDIWAPELHFLDGKWYMYFAADKDGDNATHRIYVLENEAEDPTSSGWKLIGKIADPDDRWAIDATIFTYKGINYIAWSGWEASVDDKQCIYVAKLKNPTTIDGKRVKISQPTYTWEDRINEGPEALLNDSGQLFLTYSGNGCWSDDYCLGLLTLKKDGDPMNPDDWAKASDPVFTKNVQGGAYGPGHNGFFKSPDGTQDWIIYHANGTSGEGCGDNRNPRIQNFSWKSDGTPNFGTPVPMNAPIPVPSGE